MAQKDRTFVVLDGLRGVAALAILMRHGDMYFGNRLYESYLAVDFFFALSGFVLMHAYGRKIAEGELPTLQFMTIRVIRLYPLYMLSVVASAILIVHDKIVLGRFSASAMLEQFLAAAFFVPNVVDATTPTFPLNLPSWSLSCELVGNFAFAIVLKRFGLRGVAAFTAAAAALLLWAALTRRLGFGLWQESGLLDNGFQGGSVAAGLARVAFAFFCGALLYAVWRRRAGRATVHPLVIATALFALVTAHPETAIQPAYDLIASMLLFPLLIWLAAGSRASGLLAGVFEVLGTASYGIYVLQVPVYHLSLILRARLGPDANPYAFGVATVAAMFLLVLFLDRHYDLPLRRKWLRSLAKPASVAPQRAPLPSA